MIYLKIGAVTAALFLSLITPNLVMAGTVEEEENFLEAEEVTNSFYMPEEAFSSKYEYEDYCKRMYEQGYMNEDYDWTPAAKNFINTPTLDNSTALDEARKVEIEERIENGEMLSEENPFLTYEEKQLEKKKRKAEEKEQYSEEDKVDDKSESLDESNTDASDEELGETPEDIEDANGVEDSEDTEIEKTEEKSEEKSSFDIINKIIFVVCIIAIILASLYRIVAGKPTL